MKRLVRTGALVALFALGGCAIIHKPAQNNAGIANPDAWQAHQKRMRALSGWSLQGRVASGKLLGWTGNLNWRQDGGHFDVRLSGPLGAGGMRASGTLERVHIRTAKRDVTTRHPEALVARTLGFEFPLKPLRYWARGIPAPGDVDAITVDASGRLRGLTQNAWRIGYKKYVTTQSGQVLPKRIVLDNGRNRLRLVIDRWFDLRSDPNRG